MCVCVCVCVCAALDVVASSAYRVNVTQGCNIVIGASTVGG